MLRYNASLPTKFMPAPGYTAYVAPEKYAQIGGVIGLGGKAEERRRALFDARRRAAATRLGCRAARDAGGGEAEFDAALPELA